MPPHRVLGARLSSCTNLSGPCEDPGQSHAQETRGLSTHRLFVYPHGYTYVFVCVSVCASVSLISYASFSCLYVSLCMFICVCFCVSMCLWVYLCHCGWCISLCVYLSENAFLCVYLCPCTVVGASLRLTLRRRGLLVHVDMPVTRLDQWYPVERFLVVGFIPPTKHHHTALRLASIERRERGDPWRTVTTSLSESFASPPIKALTRSPSTDA